MRLSTIRTDPLAMASSANHSAKIIGEASWSTPSRYFTGRIVGYSEIDAPACFFRRRCAQLHRGLILRCRQSPRILQNFKISKTACATFDRQVPRGTPGHALRTIACKGDSLAADIRLEDYQSGV